ncbi:MAG TPA: methyl-accepting chemotaxis protein [Actinobacteria bacterium]|nr:methyl-accepting chemotaxis protein [Actinomycetes bacterium]HEX21679.1 methyl-accepting chemotaxis protein [Actinomycetota bacterium]
MARMIDRKSLNFKIPLLLGLAVIVPLLILTLLFSFEMSRLFVREKVGDMMNLADAKFVHLMDFLDIIKGEVRKSTDNEETNKILEQYNATGDPKILAPLQEELKRDVKYLSLTHKNAFNQPVPTRRRFEEFLLLDTSGKVIASSKQKSIGKDLSSTDYYATNKMNFIEAHREKSGKVVFGYAMPIKEGDKLLGIAIAKINTDIITMLVTGEIGNVTGGKLFFAGIGKNTDLYIIDKNGYMITQSMVTKKNTILKRKGSQEPLTRLLKTELTGDYVTNIGARTGAREAMGVYKNRQGQQVAIVSMPVFQNLWSLVVEEKTSNAFSTIISVKRYFIFAILLVGIIAIMTSFYLINRSVIKPLAQLNYFAKEITAGNLELQTPVSTDDEIGRLGRLLNEMGTTISQSLEYERQGRESLEDMIAKYTAMVKRSKDQALMVVNSVERSEKVAGSGVEVIRAAAASMLEIREKTLSIAKNANGLSSQVKKISEIIVSSNSITEQSNILAINASIEASKAGAAGKGFSVVADEVGKLAEQSKQATARIEDILKTIERSVNKMVKEIEGGADMAEQGEVLAKKTSVAISSLTEAIKENAASAKRILDFVESVSQNRPEPINDLKRASNL